MKILWTIALFILSMVIGYYVSIDPIKNPPPSSPFVIIGGLVYLGSLIGALPMAKVIIYLADTISKTGATNYNLNKFKYSTIFMITSSLLVLIFAMALFVPHYEITIHYK